MPVYTGIMPTAKGKTPIEDKKLLITLRIIRAQNPDMGRARVLRELKDKYKMKLSDKRLKKMMDKYHLNTAEIVARENLPDLSANPFASQRMMREQADAKQAGAMIFLWGNGEWDYSINFDKCMLVINTVFIQRTVQVMNEAFEGIAGHERCFDEESAKAFACMTPVRRLWWWYKAGAKIAGIRPEHAVRQFEAEYKIDPRKGKEEHRAKRVENDRCQGEYYKIYKHGVMDSLRAMSRDPRFEGWVNVDQNGEPIWDEESQGPWAFLVVRFSKLTRVADGFVAHNMGVPTGVINPAYLMYTADDESGTEGSEATEGEYFEVGTVGNGAVEGGLDTKINARAEGAESGIEAGMEELDVTGREKVSKGIHAADAICEERNEAD